MEMILIFSGVYILPSITALARGHQHKIPIVLLNILLGWTLIGWVAALVWSAMPVQQPQTTNP